MNTLQQGITTLLRCAITGERLPLPEGFELEAALEDIRRHSMVTLVYEGALNCGIDAKSPVMQELFQKYLRAYMKSEGQVKLIGKIFSAFDEQGIDYMPLKGSKMKALYPKPELRIMGDADILIRMEQYERIIPIMESLGFTAGVESDHELIWKSKALFLELHKRLIPSYNEDFYAYFGDGWQLAKQKNGTRYSMTPEDEMVYLFTHFAKHYRDGGIGCRHVVDLWVFLRSRPDMDEAAVKAELEKMQLLVFYENIRNLMSVWFEGARSDEKMDFITDFIFTSGDWGRAETRFASQMVKKSKHSALSFNGKLMYTWGVLFPSVKSMEQKYTVLKKAPWLLPAVWVYRPVYKLLFEREAFGRQKKKIGMADQKQVDTRRQVLNYVGLDYNF